jgi:hypothetical protein
MRCQRFVESLSLTFHNRLKLFIGGRPIDTHDVIDQILWEAATAKAKECTMLYEAGPALKAMMNNNGGPDVGVKAAFEISSGHIPKHR